MQRRPERRALRRGIIIAAAIQSALLLGCSEGDTRSYEPRCSLDELETFDSAIPAGWTVVNGGSGAETWTWYQGLLDWDFAPLAANGGVLVDSRAGAYGEADDADLETPLYDIGNCAEATVSFRYYYKDNPDDDQDIGEVYLIPGGVDTPVLVREFDTSNPPGVPASYSFPVTETLLNERDSFSVLFHYEGRDDWGWYVDDVAVTGVL